MGRRRTPPAFRDGQVAVDDIGDRRQPVRAAVRPPPDRAPEDRRDGLVLPRHRRRDARDPRSRRCRGQPPRRRRPAGRPVGDDTGRAVQRSRCARRGTRAWRRRCAADGAGAHQHRHRAAPARLPRGRPGDHPATRGAVDHRRDPHDLSRSGRVHEGLGTRSRHRRDRQTDRWWVPGGDLRRHRRDRGRHSTRRCTATTPTSVESGARWPAVRWRRRPSERRCRRRCSRPTTRE